MEELGILSPLYYQLSNWVLIDKTLSARSLIASVACKKSYPAGSMERFLLKLMIDERKNCCISVVMMTSMSETFSLLP